MLDNKFGEFFFNTSKVDGSNDWDCFHNLGYLIANDIILRNCLLIFSSADFNKN